jgi:uncharacterized protein
VTDATAGGDAVPSAWVISDGAAGNERQALALSAALGLDATIKRIHLRPPWRWLAPRLLSGARMAFTAPIKPPWPDIAIGCGRQAALLTRALREWSGGSTFTVQILDPRIDPAQFDVVVAPRHDGLQGVNVIGTLGALNAVDAEWLERARVEFSTLQQLPAPRTAVLIGGPRHDLNLDAAWLEGFVACLQALLQSDGGSLMITFSRRTPAAWRERLHGAFNSGCVHFWGDSADGTNPYPGYLAYAERIVVTPDSVNMLSEACATGVPVLTCLPANARGKIAAFHAALRAQSRLHELGAAATSTLPQPAALTETVAVAKEIARRYVARRQPQQQHSPTETS